jgi:ATP-dependent RNA helicase DDX54/DBP10
MPRFLSPAASENEFDITHALLNHGSSSGSEDDASPRPRKKAKFQPKLDATTIFANSNDQKVATHGAKDDDSDYDSDEAFIAAQQSASNRKSANLKGRTVKKGGGFQVMGLNPNLFKAITRKGFSVPTPIQRKTIPLIMEGYDVVGMARTGSGKTAAFVIPLIEKLKAHTAKVGARGLILSPSRELALQTLKVVKELCRGTDLKTVLIVGGDSLEEQFGFLAGNPDILVATPGRFCHLKLEMNMDLSSIKYIVFDEADRLFEMGFAAQLSDILASLPATRQSLLFSATLPKSLVEFARAGLHEPRLVRLDTEGKISPELKTAFFSVKSAEKEGALLYLLSDVIKIPTGRPDSAADLEAEKEEENSDRDNEKEKSNPTWTKKKFQKPTKNVNTVDSPTAYSTLIFAATKHHVDYLYTLLDSAGYAVSFAYSSLDQSARRSQTLAFRAGRTHIFIVTDLAARGIDIPVLANVINYDFPAQAKIFVHRVGRTARAGKEGWAYSLIQESDVPYMLDLHLFLGRPLKLGLQGQDADLRSEVVLGSIPRDALGIHVEAAQKLLNDSDDLSAQRDVSTKGEKLYLKTRAAASLESARRSRSIVTDPGWTESHPLLRSNLSEEETRKAELDTQREAMLQRLGRFKPQETIFELGRHAAVDGDIIRRLRKKLPSRHSARAASPPSSAVQGRGGNADSEYKRIEEAQLSINPTSGSNFTALANSLSMDLGGEEAQKGFGSVSRVRKWDPKKKDYVSITVDPNDPFATINNSRKKQSAVAMAAQGNARGKKAMEKKGVYEKWLRKHRGLVAAGSGMGLEGGEGSRGSYDSRRFRHKAGVPRPDADGDGAGGDGPAGAGEKKSSGGFAGKPSSGKPSFGKPSFGKPSFGNGYDKGKGKMSGALKERAKGGSIRGGRKVKSEIRSNDQIAKTRKIEERKQAKNGRGGSRGGRGRGRGRR